MPDHMRTESQKLCLFLKPQTAVWLKVTAASHGARGVSDLIEQWVAAAQTQQTQQTQQTTPTASAEVRS